ncbi:hypothetical protein DBR11_23245 [Pedobacter sp. HMWF019]|uniref:DUF4374 domain-containing protein n=1 Tax=Pedobacter sp. HMWF019 TaxID=2056856 RepID=UPI000D39A78C|nr:DUF4374 domain-containing protein [Pedobacter sp. HMWF019]PTS94487.1 hypothetical protein DBR11_23245 [Pedobacter sp. HMWF019]
MLFCFGLSCKRKTAAIGGKKYSIYILGKDGREYLVETNTLDSGKILPERQGILLDPAETDRDIIVKDGCYYHLNRKTKSFAKYSLQENQIKETASVPLKDFAIENYYWIGQDSLLLVGLDTENFSQVRSVLIQSDKMTLIKAADLDIPRPSGVFNSTFVGFVERKEKELFIGYTYHQRLSPSNYTTSDTMYVAVLKYPELTLLKIDKDMRSTYPGGTNLIQSYSFEDEQRNFYFMTCPGIALGNRPDLPTAIFRIKAADDTLDKNYFLDISGSVIGNHAYGIWYLGGQKAIIRSERKDLFKGLSDHYSTAHFEFYLLDLASKRVIRKLDLPLDKGTRRECVIVKNGVAYIAVNSTKEGNFIWLYDLATGTLKKGLELAGDTDFIMRIDQLNL